MIYRGYVPTEPWRTVMGEVFRERGQIVPPGRGIPDPIDAQWAARDKAQDARNKMREDFYVPRKSALFPQ
jgi:hypothetical protein